MATKAIKIEEADLEALKKIMKEEGLSSLVTTFHHVIMIYTFITTHELQDKIED